MISRKKLDMKQFHHFGAVFVKEDRETGKVVQKPCLFVRLHCESKNKTKLLPITSPNVNKRFSKFFRRQTRW